jgi:uridine phosphorylase
MPTPNFKDKHLQESLFHPTDYVDYNVDYKKFKEKFKGKLPTKYIITYQSYVERYFIRKYEPKRNKLDTGVNSHSILTYKDIGFIKMAGIGAPNIVATVEELIALGGREFINIGTAGGLHKQGVFVCNKALRDEGTSYHYIKDTKFLYPDKNLTNLLIKAMKNKEMEFLKGPTWSIDAPYRETRAEIERYAEQGIMTVEMEASALFAVCKYRKVKIAAAFVVSDILGKKWTPMFDKSHVRTEQYKLIDAAVSCFGGNK